MQYATLQEFSEAMSKIEKIDEFTVGRACYGNSRAHFRYVDQDYYLNSSGYRTVPNNSRLHEFAKAVWMLAVEPSDVWWSAYSTYGKERAKKIAAYYKCNFEEEFYVEVPNTWFFYKFKGEKGWDSMMKFAYDRYTGEFRKLFGEEPSTYSDGKGNQLVMGIEKD